MNEHQPSRSLRRETRRVEARRPRKRETTVWTWNRRLHFYLGLYFIFFIWLFSISGLVLNHGKWPFADFWPEREETSSTHAIAIPVADGDLEAARALMSQLGIVGEVNSTERDPTGQEFKFQVTRPGQTVNVEADFAARSAEVKEIRVNAWGVMSALHHFTGVSMDDPERQRDWWLTTLWSIAMDAIALGLVLLVASGLYLWYRLKRKRALGLVAIAAGLACCGFFLFGLGLV
jgi:hypothetical protein